MERRGTRIHWFGGLILSQPMLFRPRQYYIRAPQIHRMLERASSGGMVSMSDKIALGVGIGVGLPATLATLFMCIRGFPRFTPGTEV